MTNEYTTIAIKKELKKELDKLKIHPNQSYDEVIEKLIKKEAKDDIKPP